MKTKTADLTGAALDWAVAKCEGMSLDMFLNNRMSVCPSTDWAQGGPIIEREGITSGSWDTSPFMAHKGLYSTVNSSNPRYVGPTPLIAAMRCYVASKFGKEIDIPDELT
jgi:hypothetical protein